MSATPSSKAPARKALGLSGSFGRLAISALTLASLGAWIYTATHWMRAACVDGCPMPDPGAAGCAAIRLCTQEINYTALILAVVPTILALCAVILRITQHPRRKK